MQAGSLVALVGPPLIRAIVDSAWEGLAAVVIYAAARPFLATAARRYTLALALLAAMPLLFLVSLVSGLLAGQQTVDWTLFTGPISPAAALAGSDHLSHLVWGWSAGALFMAVRYTGGWMWLRMRLVRTAAPVPDAVLARLDALCRRAGLRTRVAVRACRSADGPMLVGVVRPLVLLPASLVTGAPPETLEAALLHEIFHLKRWDHWGVIVNAAAETLLFYHPGVWWLSREVRREREFRCDDDCVHVIGSRRAYAHALVALEDGRGGTVLPAVELKGEDFMGRIKRLFGRGEASSRAGGGLWLGAAVAVALSAYGFSASTSPKTPEPQAGSQAGLAIAWLPPSIRQWEPLIVETAARYQVPAEVLALVMLNESGGDAKAVSSSGARGLMQVMPATGRWIAQERGFSDFTDDELFDPATSLDFGTWYLSQQMARFADQGERQLPLALAAYNAGPTVVSAYVAGRSDLTQEAAQYRDALMSMWSERSQPESSTFLGRLARLRARLAAGFIAPATGRLSNPFGSTKNPFGTAGKDFRHAGVDIAARNASPVAAAMNGTVSEAGEDDLRGKYVILEHSLGVQSRYYHLGAIAVAERSAVAGGQVIGEIGSTGKSTGPHLHFEIREYGRPVDPSLYGFTAR